jgi:hypothetical protein
MHTALTKEKDMPGSSVHAKLSRLIASAILLLSWLVSAQAVEILPGATGFLSPPPGNAFGVLLQIADPRGLIELEDLDGGTLPIATQTLMFDSSGDGRYEWDATYRSTARLIDIESLFRDLDLVGRLDADPAGGDDNWVSEHTELNSGKIIWSFSDGTVITLDPSPNSSQVNVHTLAGSFVNPNAPVALLAHPARIQILNNTPGLVEALFFVPLVGDFNNDQELDCDDVDALVAEIAGGGGDLAFDLTGDGLITLEDLDEWLTFAGTVNVGGPYLGGDANLDGIVDGLDFVEWNANKFTTMAAWCAGDFNADGFIDGLDFIIWNGNKFMSSDHAVAVPEPIAPLLLLAAMVVVFRSVIRSAGSSQGFF